ncbi:hypothetical protein L7F22_010250 [Adiantum nelumboides]|nr:hypothetical protein [Adiantum nelumboides]
MKGRLQRREESESQDESMEDVAPRRRRAQRSPTPTKRKRSPHSPHRRESKREEKNSKKKKERKRSPSSLSSSPSFSSDEGSGYSSQEKQRRGHRRSYAAWKRSSKLKKFKEGGKNISFLTYDDTFGATDKVLAFIQQFDAAFGDEGFTESSKLRHVAMHFQKSARQWWASLRANGEAPKTWKALRASIMKQFLASDAKDKVLTEWRSLKLSPYESIHKYVDKFWDLHLKATVYKKIDFEEQKKQFCAGLLEDMNEINFQQGAKRNLKPMEAKEKQEYKGKNFSQNSSKGTPTITKLKRREFSKDLLGGSRLASYESPLPHKEPDIFRTTGALVTKTTVEVVLPNRIVGAIFGDGMKIAQIRQMSGAQVNFLDVRPGALEAVVEISGTPEQTQSAQSILQAFIMRGQTSSLGYT